LPDASLPDATLKVVALWSVAGTAFDVDAFLAPFPEVRERAHLWRPGEPSPFQSRQPEGTAGFNLWVGEGAQWAEAIAETRTKLAELAPLLLALKTLGRSSEVDFGLTVGTLKGYVRSAVFEPADLAWFAERNISLRVTAYPVAAS
jgi:hypothetical protein